jgi:xylose isomerase
MKERTPLVPKYATASHLRQKLGMYKGLGFDGVQFHDDDAVPDLDNLSAAKIAAAAKKLKKQLDKQGLYAEFVAPRLWMDPLTVDGGFTSNDPKARAYARERFKEK